MKTEDVRTTLGTLPLLLIAPLAILTLLFRSVRVLLVLDALRPSPPRPSTGSRAAG
ncbi:hypothetical protein ACFXP3_14305 [Streptomyces sp. NPDC059096]|uniref:hypothetical protein n=1 Tax=Streptomyces sp. NPDC059096 TaxID=3346727 RepID=UPI00368C4C12